MTTPLIYPDIPQAYYWKGEGDMPPFWQVDGVKVYREYEVWWDEVKQERSNPDQ